MIPLTVISMGRITKDDVSKVAKLARLELPDEAINTYTTQLESILEYVGQLEAIDTDGEPGFVPLLKSL